MSEQKTALPPAPYRVKITACSRSSWWYARLVDREFDVNDPGPRMDYVLWEDYRAGGDGPWRHIAQQDCEIIKARPRSGAAMENE